MGHTPAMTGTHNLSDTELHALSLDGLVWREGSLYGSGPRPPLLAERATLIAARLPDWAIGAGHTAGWVWTGLGRPEPWSVMCAKQPALSPMLRSVWKPRARELHSSDVVSLRGLTLLSPRRTVTDLLVCPGADEVAAAQIYELTTAEGLEEAAGSLGSIPPRLRERLRLRRAVVNQWWRDYPVVTR